MYVDTDVPTPPSTPESPGQVSAFGTPRMGPRALRSMRSQNAYASFHHNTSMSFWKHLTSRGHDGSVNCVAAGVNVEYIVSGGKDFTTRVWKKGKEHEAFDLEAVLTHDDRGEADAELDEGSAKFSLKRISFPFRSDSNMAQEARTGVTAVGFAGDRGPVVSGTCDGQVGVLCLSSQRVWSETLHTGDVEDMFVEVEVEAAAASTLDLESIGGPWLVGTASKDGQVKVLRIKGDAENGGQVSSIDDVCVCPHEEPALKVRYIHALSEDRASIASCTRTYVHLWSLKGNLVARFAAGKGDICSLTAANKTKGSLLFAGGKDYISVWGLVRGELCDKIGNPKTLGKEPDEEDLKPLATYQGTGTHLDIDQAGLSTDFAVDLRGEYTCCMWQLAGAKPGQLLVEPPGPVNLLIHPDQGKLEILRMLSHESKVTDLRVVEERGNANGAALLVSCRNGKIFQWDLEGHDAGEICAELRSLSTLEIIVPLAVLVLTFLQVLSFAFGPSIPWRTEVRKTSDFTTNIAFGRIDLAISIPKEYIFMPEVFFFAAIMVTFVLFAALGVAGKVDGCKRRIHGSNRYRDERLSNKRCGVRHLMAHGVGRAQSCIALFMWACSTVLIAPMFKTCVQVFECDSSPGHAPFIKSAPNIECYVGMQRHMMFVLLVILPVYFVSVLPFAAVAGDVNYISQQDFINPKPLREDGTRPDLWAESARRKATVLHLGPLHPNPQTIYAALCWEAIAKAVLPCLQTIDTPWIQMGSVTLVGFLMLVGNLRYPNKVDDHMKHLVRGLRAMTFCAMLCGCVTVALGPESWTPLALLVLATVLVAAFTVWKMRSIEIKSFEVMRYFTSESMGWSACPASPSMKSTPSMPPTPALEGGLHSIQEEDEVASSGPASKPLLKSSDTKEASNESAQPLLGSPNGSDDELKGVHVEIPGDAGRDQERSTRWTPFRLPFSLWRSGS